jgi:hypothetical protein
MIGGMKKPQARKTGLLALVATFLVVGGVVFVAMLATPAMNPDAKPPEFLPSPVATPHATSTGILVVDVSGARILKNGESKTLSWPGDVKLLGLPVSQLEGVDALTGERVYLANGFERDASAGIHSPDGRRSLYPAPAKADGTGSVEVRMGSDRQTIVLRLTNGRGVKEVTPVGWWNDETMAVAGRTTSTRVMYAATLSGSVTPVASLPETADRLAMYGGVLWYVTAEPGDGLESPFVPPSELHRVPRSGSDERLVRSEEQVIMRYVPRGTQVAYEAQDESVTLLSDRAMREAPLGSGTPLAFRDATHLLIRKDMKIVSKDVITGFEETLLDLTSAGAMIFPLPESSTIGQ